MEEVIERLEPGDVADMLWWFVLISDRKKLKFFLTGTWLIWKNRNEVWHDKKGWDPETPSVYGRELLQAFIGNSLFGSVDTNWLSNCWRSPKQGEFIIMVDGSWRSNEGKMGLGVICKDHNGVVLWSLAKHVNGGSCASEAEGRALEWASELAEEEGLNPVSFEVDSADVAKALVHHCSSRHWASGWLTPTLDRMLRWPGWRVTLIERDHNKAADLLAKKACAEEWSWSNRNAVPLVIWSVL